MFGPCKVCAEKDKRVSALAAEILFLRSLVRPPASNRQLSAIEFEADGIMSGQSDQIELQSHQQSQMEEDAEVLAERDAILNGSY